jgi:hypothetical protein
MTPGRRAARDARCRALAPYYPDSHGCIRIPYDIATFFHKRIKILGTPTYVRETVRFSTVRRGVVSVAAGEKDFPAAADGSSTVRWTLSRQGLTLLGPSQVLGAVSGGRGSFPPAAAR